MNSSPAPPETSQNTLSPVGGVAHPGPLFGVYSHAPPPPQASSVQGSPSSQETGVPLWQESLAQNSLPLQASPSSQETGVPFWQEPLEQVSMPLLATPS